MATAAQGSCNHHKRSSPPRREEYREEELGAVVKRRSEEARQALARRLEADPLTRAECLPTLGRMVSKPVGLEVYEGLRMMNVI